MNKLKYVFLLICVNMFGFPCLADISIFSDKNAQSIVQSKNSWDSNGEVKIYKIENIFEGVERKNWELCSSPDEVDISIGGSDEIEITFNYKDNPFDFRYSFGIQENKMFVVQLFLQLFSASSDFEFSDEKVYVVLGEGDVYDLSLFSKAKLKVNYNNGNGFLIDLSRQKDEKFIFDQMVSFLKKGASLDANKMTFLDMKNIPNSGKAWGRKQRLWMFKEGGDIFLGMMDLEGKKSFPPGKLKPFFIPRVSIFSTRNSSSDKMPAFFYEYLKEQVAPEINFDELDKYRSVLKKNTKWSFDLKYGGVSYLMSVKDNPGPYIWLHENFENRTFSFEANVGSDAKIPFSKVSIERTSDQKNSYKILIDLNQKEISKNITNDISDFLVLIFWGMGAFIPQELSEINYSLEENSIIFEVFGASIDLLVKNSEGEVISRSEKKLDDIIGDKVRWSRVFSKEPTNIYEYQFEKTLGGSSFSVRRLGNYEFSKLRKKEFFFQPEGLSVAYSRKDSRADMLFEAKVTRISPDAGEWDYALNYLDLYPRLKFLSENSYVRNRQVEMPEFVMPNDLKLKLTEEGKNYK